MSLQQPHKLKMLYALHEHEHLIMLYAHACCALPMSMMGR